MKKAVSTRRRVTSGKLMASLAAITMVGVVGVVGTRAAISDTTDNPGNEFNAGEITLADNDAGTFLYNVDNALPGDPPTEKCIAVTYTSTPALDSNVELFMDTPIDSVGPYVDMKIEVGAATGDTFPDCTGFVPIGAPIYTGTLDDFQTNHGAAGDGVVYSPNGAGTHWVNNDTVVYKVSLSVSNRARQPGENFSGLHTYTWRATTV